MSLNPSRVFTLVWLLVLLSLACGLGGGAAQPAPEEAPTPLLVPDTDTPVPTDTRLPETEAPQDTPLPTPTDIPEISADQGPGWHIYSNANYVNGLALHEGTLWAATLGGVVAWDLESGEPTKYTTLDGLKHISTYDVVVCPLPKPRLVVATEIGLSFLDLTTGEWDNTPITPEEGSAASSQISKLYCDEENGRLLIGYYGLGILDIESGEWRQITENEGLAWDVIDDMATIGEYVWTVGYKGISIIGEEEITQLNEGAKMPDEWTEALAVGENVVWLGARSGLLRYSEGEWTLYDRDTLEDFPSGPISSLALAPDGSLWVGAYTGGVCHFDPLSGSCLDFYEYESTREAFIGGDRLTDLVVTPGGEVYYSNYGGGIMAFDGEQWQRLYLDEDRLASNFVSALGQEAAAINQDGQGSLWVGGDGGAQRLDPGDPGADWEYIGAYGVTENGPPSNAFWGVFPGPDGDMWFAHDNQRASKFNGEFWVVYGPEQGVPGSVNAIAPSTDGPTWLGTSEGLAVIGGASIMLYTEADGLPDVNVRALLLDGDTLWIGTTGGLARYLDSVIEVVLDADTPGLPDENIGVIIQEADGSLLLGTSGGLARFDGEQVTTLLEPEPIAGLLGSSVRSVSDIAIGLDGSLWVGTYAGLYHGDGATWEQLTTAEGLPTNNINAVFVDHLGNVWVAGGYTDAGGGLARYVPE